MLSTDTFKYAVAGVLLQTASDDVERPVGYFSCKMEACERNYMIYGKELLAVVESLKH